MILTYLQKGQILVLFVSCHYMVHAPRNDRIQFRGSLSPSTHNQFPYGIYTRVFGPYPVGNSETTTVSLYQRCEARGLRGVSLMLDFS
jgi:hypothetical protein